MKLLLLPGTLCDDAVWAPIAAGLAELAACVVGDVSAHDRVEAIADSLLLAHPGPIAVAGFSFGGFVAMQMAARASGRVIGLALIGTVAQPLPVEQHPDRMRRLAVAEAHGVDAYIQALLPVYLHPDHAGDPGLTEVIAAMARRLGLDVLRRQVLANMARPDARPLLPDLRMPTLVVCGAEDSVCKPEDHRAMAAKIPHCVFVELPGAGHFVTLEQPGAVIAAMRTWLARVASQT